MSGTGRPSRIAVAAVAALASLGSALGASAATQHVDTTFGRNGVQIYLPGTTFRDAESAPGNAMYVAGTTIVGTRAQWRIERVLYDGSHDPSFGKDGVVMLPTPNNSAYFTGLALTDSARAVLMGVVQLTLGYAAVARRRSNTSTGAGKPAGSFAPRP